MRLLQRTLARLRGLFRGAAVAREIRDELEFHRAMRERQYEAAGASSGRRRAPHPAAGGDHQARLAEQPAARQREDLAGLAGAQMDSVRQRSREVAIRIALGARPGLVRRRVITRAMLIVAAGLAAGLLGGAFAGRSMSTFLFGVTPVDGVTATIVIASLAAIGWLAALWPAHRAARIDPATTLREDA